MHRLTPLLLAALLISCVPAQPEDRSDLIRVESPRPGDTVGASIVVKGEARGSWFFEATFPIVLEDEDGNALGSSYATASDEWMIEEFVPFEGTMEAELGDAERGTLVLRKANASGLPEHDDELRVPVRFELDANAETGIQTEEVDYGAAQGYLTLPNSDVPSPALILIHEWWGLNDNIRWYAQQFAAQGYVALAVDLYNGKSTEDSSVAGELAGAVREDLDGAFANLSSAVEFLTSRPEVDSRSLASVGWCFGGGWSYQMAQNDLGVRASVIYYGQFNPEDDLEKMRATILGHFGEEDQGIPVDDVKAFRAKLQTIGGEHQIFIYENEGHGFARELDTKSARQAWQRTLEFLGEQL